MKIHNILWFVPVLWMLGACSKKEEPVTEQAPVTEETAPESAPVAPPPQPVTPALSPEERAAKLGFVRHLPQDTGVVISIHNGSRHASRIKGSKIWQTISGEFGMDFDDDDEFEEDEDFEGEDLPDDGLSGPSALFAREFTIAVGSGVGGQTSNLMTLNNRINHIQMRSLVKSVAEAAEEGDFSDLGMMLSQRFSEDFFKQLVTDPESGVALFERMNMPPLYLAFGTTPENRDALAQQLAASSEMFAFFGDIVEPVEVERNGETFAGNRISGAKIAESMAEEREMMEETFDAGTVDRLIAAIAKKDLVVMSGLTGDYAVFFIGSSEDDLVLVENLGDSLVAGDALAFTDAYASKDVAAVIYGQKEALSQMYEHMSGLASYASGLREGFAASEGFGETRDIETLLRLVGEREAAVYALQKMEATGTVAYFEDGLKIELFGGIDSGWIDWQATNRLAGLADTPGIAVFSNMTSGKAHSEASRAYLEALTETLYALAMKVAELPFENEEMLQFREMAGMFDQMFRRDAVALWEALSGDFSAGIGAETALVIDLNGSPPPIPGVPQNVVDEGKFPRISLVAPVTDRAKLASAWQSIDATATGIMAKISEMTETPIPMQKPMDSERAGFTTWFFQMPFFTDEFMPSVTVGDEWFAASTSRNQALDLLARAGSGESSNGLTMLVNFDTLREFVVETTGLLAANPELIPLEEDDLENVGKAIDAFEDFEKLSVHSRMESGQVRTSIHLKTR